MTMKPKFRVGDRVKTSDGEEFTVGGFYGDGFYNISNDEKSFIGIAGFALELVGCGIPAPALRWDPSGVWAKVLGAFFRIAYNGMKYNCLIGEEVFDQGYASIDEAREACQAYWQQLWDKEMLISRDLPVSL